MKALPLQSSSCFFSLSSHSLVLWQKLAEGVRSWQYKLKTLNELYNTNNEAFSFDIDP